MRGRFPACGGSCVRLLSLVGAGGCAGVMGWGVPGNKSLLGGVDSFAAAQKTGDNSGGSALIGVKVAEYLPGLDNIAGFRVFGVVNETAGHGGGSFRGLMWAEAIRRGRP